MADQKLLYVVKNLSRTRRKDFENYIINAVWNRVSDLDLKPVSQQYVKGVDGHHYFIDMYFPALNVGIEVDEAYHKSNVASDSSRERTIYDELLKLDLSKNQGYQAIRIDADTTYDNVQKAVSDAAIKIRGLYDTVRPEPWKDATAAEYFENRTQINVKDLIGFRTILEACNVLFDTQSGGYQRAYFKPKSFHTNPKLKDYHVWFPQLAVEGLPAGAHGWNNVLTADGTVIVEYNEKSPETAIDNWHKNISRSGHGPRITFAKYKNPLGITEYKFVGLFDGGTINDTKILYSRLDDNIPLVKSAER